MSNTELYNKVIDAYKSGDENLFNAAARNWAAEGEAPNFADVEARELFSAAKRNFNIWKSGAISSRVSKVRMIENIRKLAEKGLPNPYEKVVEKPVVSEETEQVVEPAAEVETTAEKKEPIHITGVLPEGKRIFPRRKKR